MPPKPDNTSTASNTPRRSHQSPHSWHIHRNLCLIHIHLCPFPSAKRKTIHKHLWLHWLKFMTISSAKRKTIYEHLLLHWLKFMTISSAKRKFIYEHLWLHLWLFLTPKKREAQNIYDSLMIIFDKKSHESPESIQDTLLKHSGNSWPYIQLIKLSNTRLLKLRNNATCCTRNNQFQHT